MALAGLAGDYFSFLARKFPTLCRHDEFMYFPRAQVPAADWWRLAHLEAPAIQAAAARVAGWEARLAALLPEIEEPEAAAAAALLRQSLKSVLRELEPGGPWERDPFFYLKVAALAWAPILAGTPRVERGDEEKLTELLAQVARLFTWAEKQIKSLSLPAQLLSANAFADACRFFDEVLPAFFLAHNFSERVWQPRLAEVSRNLRRFGVKVAALLASAPYSRGAEGLLEILTGCWGWEKDLDATAAILAEETAASLEALPRLAAGLNSRLPWTEALHCLPHSPGSQLCYTLGLKEILRLREEFAPTLGLGRFHEIVLHGGQLPFPWMEKRLQAQAA